MKQHIPDLMIISGAACVSYGAWLVFEPAGFITFGLLTLLAGIRVSK